MRPVDVFMPDGYPSETYVSPEGGRFERELEEALTRQGKIVSVVGASKTGKTTLVERTFGSQRVVVPGSRIREADDVWFQAYEQAGGWINPEFKANPVANAAALLRKHRLPLILDDFHYVDRDIQKILAREIKSAAYDGTVIVVVSLPHRSDDPVRSNPDLSGRVYSIDLGFWKPADLMRIAEIGFPKTGMTVAEPVIRRLASESLTSPQIMHTLCLETCREVKHEGMGSRRIVDEGDLDVHAVLDRAARSYVNDTALTRLRQGPARRGQERKLFGFVTADTGDVYELLVRSIAADPPQLSFTFEEIRERAARLAPGERPDLLPAMAQWNDLFEDADYRPVEWDSEQRELTILDPHLYFWIRHEFRDGEKARGRR
jgi:hypothetical protein